jgi:hypothetical protein
MHGFHRTDDRVLSPTVKPPQRWVRIVAAMSELTVILRLQGDPSDELKGTLEQPGGPPEVFRDSVELIERLVTWQRVREDEEGT